MFGFRNDPFFNYPGAQMQAFDQMMSPLSGGFPDPFAPMAVTDGRRAERPSDRRHQQVSPYARDPFGSMFQQMDAMMGNMHRMMAAAPMQMQAASNDPNSQFMCHSQVYSYTNDGQGQPRVYQASNSTRQAGGMKQTQKSMRDSYTGVEQQEIGRYINERGQVMRKSKNHHTGDREEQEELIHLEEAEKERFAREWRNRTGQHGRHGANAIQGQSRYRQSHRPRQTTPALTYKGRH